MYNVQKYSIFDAEIKIVVIAYIINH